MAIMPLKFITQWRYTMKKPNTIEQEINQIRLRIYEEIKDMTTEERIEHANRIGEAAVKKYGFKRVTRTKEKV